MTVRGFGSVSSPIVIDDDEDEAYVEQQLDETSRQVQHSGSSEPQRQAAIIGFADVSVAGDYPGAASAPVLGQKRKFREMSPSRSHPIPQAATGNATNPAVPAFSDMESKSARKKRRKRERLAAEQAATQPALVPTPASPPTPQRTAPGNGSFVRFENRHLQDGSSMILPPLSFTPSLSSRYPLVTPPPYASTLPAKPSALTTSMGQNLVSRPAALSSPQAGQSKGTSANLQFLARAEPPVPSFVEAAPVPPAILATAPTVAPLPHIPVPVPSLKRTIGMPADAAPPIKHGLYVPVNSNFPAPHPARALVMELLPKKFRNREFIRCWATRFSPLNSIRIDCDVRVGKALVEFSNPESAQQAFDSPRLTGGEGREHVRVYWYREDGPHSAPRLDLEEGEIQEDDARDQLVEAPPSKKKVKAAKQKVVKKKARAVAPPPLASAVTPPQSQLPSSDWAGRLRSNAGSALSAYPVFFRPSLFNGWPYVNKSTSVTILEPANAQASSSKVEEERPRNREEEESMDLESDDGYEPPRPPSREISPIWDLWEPFRAPKGVASTGSPIWSDQSIASSRPASPALVSWEETLVDDLQRDPGLLDTASAPDAFRTVSPWQSDDGLRKLDSAGDPARRSPSVVVEAPPAIASPVAIHAPIPRPAQLDTISHLHHAPDIAISQPSQPSPPPPVVAVSPPVSTPTPIAAKEASAKAANDSRLALLARAKELEERIARTKEELARKAAGISGSSTPANTTPSPVPRTVSAIEDDLRRSVLASKNKAVGAAEDLALPLSVVQTTVESAKRLPSVDAESSEHGSSTEPSIQSSSTSILDDSAQSTTTSTNSHVIAGDRAYVVTQTTTHTTAVHSAASLDDMAISFITETIQTVKPPSQRSTPALEKMQLAAKQKRLEQQISESKILMAKLSAARTKGEKDQIMAILREHRRVMEEDMKTDAIESRPSSAHTSVTSYTQTRQSVYRSHRMPWPETAHDAGIFVISDDEDDNEG